MPIDFFIWDSKTCLIGGTTDYLPLLSTLYVIRRIIADLEEFNLPIKKEHVPVYVCAVLHY